MAKGRNPYESPKAGAQAGGGRSAQRDDLKVIAMDQKAILFCIVISLTVNILIRAAPGALNILLPIAIIVGLLSVMFVVLLSSRLYNVGLGILLGFLTLIPCVSLIVLVVVNGKATSVLKANGYTVGFFGASLSEF